MSKVISFSISDRYLDKLRSLYPSLTDNLAAKQFLTDGLESSLGNSLDGSLDERLDGSLDERLDGKLKTLIESRLDGLLDDRLDDAVGKLISPLSERMARLEERLDETVEPISSSPPATDAIEDVPITHKAIAERLGFKSQTKLNYWIKNGKIPAEYADRCQFNPDKTKILWR